MMRPHYRRTGAVVKDTTRVPSPSPLEDASRRYNVAKAAEGAFRARLVAPTADDDAFLAELAVQTVHRLQVLRKELAGGVL
jgi:hypothetical protein